MAKIVTVADQKGGVGKSTITCNLVFGAAEAGKTVLVCDLDTQGNTSQVLTRDQNINRRRGGAEVLFTGEEWALKRGFLEGVSLLHGHAYLEEVDRDPDIMERARKLRATIRKLDYDYIIFDTPPSIGPRQLAPMFWSDVILVPVEPTPMAMSGLPTLLDTIKGALKINPGLSVRFVVNKILSSSKEQKRHVESLRQKFGSSVLAELPLRVAVADSLSYGEPAWKLGNKQTKDAWRDFVRHALELEGSFK